MQVGRQAWPFNRCLQRRVQAVAVWVGTKLTHSEVPFGGRWLLIMHHGPMVVSCYKAKLKVHQNSNTQQHQTQLPPIRRCGLRFASCNCDADAAVASQAFQVSL